MLLTDRFHVITQSAKEFQELQVLKDKILKIELQKGFDSLNAGRIIDAQDGIGALMQTIDNA